MKALSIPPFVVDFRMTIIDELNFWNDKSANFSCGFARARSAELLSDATKDFV